MIRLFCEYGHIEYVRMRVLCRVEYAGYAIRIRAAFPQEYAAAYGGDELSAQGATVPTDPCSLDYPPPPPPP